MGYAAGFEKAIEVMDVFKDLTEKAKDKIRQEAIDETIRKMNGSIS